MRRLFFFAVLAAGAGVAWACSAFSGEADARGTPDGTPDAAAEAAQGDAAPPTDAGPPPDAGRCDPKKPFGTPVALTSLNGPFAELGPHLTADELTIVFASERTSFGDIYIASRKTPDDPFGVRTSLAT